MKKAVVLLAVCAIALGWTLGAVKPAGAVAFFKAQFEQRYVKENPTSPSEEKLADSFKTTKCFVCHVKGKEKKIRNEYGEALSKLLDKDNFKADRREAEPDKCAQEVQAALEKVEAMHSKPDPASPTYKDLIEAGMLPAAAK